MTCITKVNAIINSIKLELNSTVKVLSNESKSPNQNEQVVLDYTQTITLVHNQRLWIPK